MKPFSLGSLLGVAVLVVAGGCGDDAATNRPKVVPVTGVVTYQGRPVEGASVSFRPQQQGVPGAVGRTDAEGRFELGTFGDDDGAVPGEYTVTVQKMEVIIGTEWTGDGPPPPGYQPPPPPKSLVPAKYRDPRKSGLAATVSADGANDFTFDLED